MTPAWRNIASTAAWPDLAGPHRVAHRHALGGAAGLHRDHRLAARDPARDPAELARVADRLQVEQHDLGAVVVLPVLQEVVAGDVGAVAGRDERRQAEAAAGHVLQDRHAERAGLAEESGAPARRHHRRQRGVERVVGGGVDDAQRVGADEPQPVGAAHPHQLALQPPPVVAGLGEPGGDHHQPVDALVGAVEHHVGDRLGRYGDHGDVDVVGDVADPVVGRHAGDGVAAEFTTYTRPWKSPSTRLRTRRCPTVSVRRLAPTTATLPASKKRWIDAVSARCSRADITSWEVTVGSMEKWQLDDPVGEPATDAVAGVAEDLLHAGVLREDLGDELLHAQLPADLGEVLEQQLTDPAVLVGRPGPGRRPRPRRRPSGVEKPLELAQRDDLLGQHQHQPDPAVVVHADGALDLALGQLGHGGEEAVVLRARGGALVELHERLGVAAPDGRRCPEPPSRSRTSASQCPGEA